MVGLIYDYIVQKEWSWYPFIPPLFSLFLALVVIPCYSRLFEDRLKAYLAEEKIQEKYPIINAVAQDRSLQIAYLNGIPSFIVAIIATLRSKYPVLLSLIVITLLLPGIPLLLNVFMRSPGFHATTRLPEGKWYSFKFVLKRRWTYLDAESKILAFLTVILIIVIFIALPDSTP